MAGEGQRGRGRQTGQQDAGPRGVRRERGEMAERETEDEERGRSDERSSEDFRRRMQEKAQQQARDPETGQFVSSDDEDEAESSGDESEGDESRESGGSDDQEAGERDQDEQDSRGE